MFICCAHRDNKHLNIFLCGGGTLLGQKNSKNPGKHGKSRETRKNSGKSRDIFLVFYLLTGTFLQLAFLSTRQAFLSPRHEWLSRRHERICCYSRAKYWNTFYSDPLHELQCSWSVTQGGWWIQGAPDRFAEKTPAVMTPRSCATTCRMTCCMLWRSESSFPRGST